MDGIFLIDKVKGKTSHDMVFIARKKLHTKKIGHCGTLDPFATGLLVITVNKATKISQFIEAESKEYIASLKLGVKTDSGDLDGNIIEEKDVELYSESQIKEVMKLFVGEIEQVPPMYSALKVNGKKLYEYARQGIEIKREARKIEIFELELINYDKENHIIDFRVKCSKGTYVRTLGEDIASKLGNIGHLIALRRTKIGDLCVEDAIDVDELDYDKIIESKKALTSMKRYFVDDKMKKDIMDGKKINIGLKEKILFCDQDENPIAVYDVDENGVFRCLRGLW